MLIILELEHCSIRQVAGGKATWHQIPQYVRGESLRGTLDFCRRNRASGSSGLSRGRDRVGSVEFKLGTSTIMEKILVSVHCQVHLPMSLTDKLGVLSS